MDKITIVGMGLIGSSLGLALKKAQVEAEIVGTDRDREVAARARRVGASDSTENNPLKAIKGAKLVILATPVGGIQELMKLFGPELEEGTVVTDTGSTKAEVLRWAEQYLPSTVSFVGGHPMAGKELSGPEAAQADLFHGATYCVIPGKNASKEAVGVVTQMAETVGAKPYFIDPVEHDSYVAAVSHLPLVLSTVLMKLNADNPSWPEISKLASNGFRDVSRLASGSPEMSRDICLTNQEGLVHWIDRFIKELHTFKELVQEGVEKPLGKAFDDAWEARDRWLQNKITSPASAPTVELPTTIETMGGLLMGDRAAGRVREMIEWQSNDKKRKS
ncbi:MAG: prephenate dehydrogenase/arogenate dehydrogenase family protein [Chloroflexi bacterium]|nr:prephenate dehydrogenase/arogenate dehydrogenase family protein [Chloroflexota bacterium]